MPTLIAGVVAVIVLYSLLQMFRAANPVVLARAIKIGGGVVALAVAAFTGLQGRTGGGDPARHFRRGPARLVAVRANAASAISAGCSAAARSARRDRASRVRSQYLDMSLDHDSGELSGQIVDGPNAGRSLDEFDLPQLLAMISGLRRRERLVT